MYKVGVYEHVTQDQLEFLHEIKFNRLSELLAWFHQQNPYQFDSHFETTVVYIREGEQDVVC